MPDKIDNLSLILSYATNEPDHCPKDIFVPRGGLRLPLDLY
jgi:hypothetical protein